MVDEFIERWWKRWSIGIEYDCPEIITFGINQRLFLGEECSQSRESYIGNIFLISEAQYSLEYHLACLLDSVSVIFPEDFLQMCRRIFHDFSICVFAWLQVNLHLHKYSLELFELFDLSIETGWLEFRNCIELRGSVNIFWNLRDCSF